MAAIHVLPQLVEGVDAKAAKAVKEIEASSNVVLSLISRLQPDPTTGPSAARVRESRKPKQGKHDD